MAYDYRRRNELSLRNFGVPYSEYRKAQRKANETGKSGWSFREAAKGGRFKQAKQVVEARVQRQNDYRAGRDVPRIQHYLPDDFDYDVIEQIDDEWLWYH